MRRWLWLCLGFPKLALAVPWTDNAVAAGVAISGIDKEGGAVFADLDDDGFPDLVVNTKGAGTTEKSYVFHSDGDGTFTEVTGTAVEDLKAVAHERGAVVGDLNHDGLPDIVLADTNGVTVFLASATNDLAWEGYYPLGGSRTSTGNMEGVLLIDWDSDGDLDVVLSTGTILQNSVNTGTFGLTAIAGGALTGLGTANDDDYATAADADADGYVEAIIRMDGGTPDIYRRPANPLVTGPWFESVAVPDLLGKGDAKGGVVLCDIGTNRNLDLFTAASKNQTGQNTAYLNTTAFGAGAAAFAAGTAPLPGLTSPAVDTKGVVCADLDNDADEDFYLVVNDGSADDRLYLQGPAGTFTLDTTFGVGAGNGQGAAWADIDRDGDIDLYANQSDANKSKSNGLFVNPLYVADGDPDLDEQGYLIVRALQEVGDFCDGGTYRTATGTSGWLDDGNNPLDEDVSPVGPLKHLDGGQGHGSMGWDRLHFGLPLLAQDGALPQLETWGVNVKFPGTANWVRVVVVPDEIEEADGYQQITIRSDDYDGDGISNSDEAKADGPADLDDDGVPNVSDPDSDGDGLSDRDEAAMAEPCDEPASADGDLIPDYLEYDRDGDGLSDGEEVLLGTDPNIEDSDLDGWSDLEDCEPTNDAFHPDADEICDGLDQNCDDVVDEGVKISWYLDADGDGFGDPGGKAELSCDPVADHVANADDCDDAAPDWYPGSDWYTDADDDGFGDADGAVAGVGCLPPLGAVASSVDCDDSAATVFPGADELCNAVDDDCDALVDDEDADMIGPYPAWFGDADGDGFGNSGSSPTLACTAPEGTADNDDDCDDADETWFPGSLWFADADGDTWGAVAVASTGCAAPASGAVRRGGDCNDSKGKGASVHPEAPEVCNGVDDDCDALVDAADPGLDLDGLPDFWPDLDGDDHGAGVPIQACSAPPGHAGSDDDCDDNNAIVYPGALEFCDETDNDCDELTDEDVVDANWYVDLDGDGFGDGSGPEAPIFGCEPIPGRVTAIGDCDDTAPVGDLLNGLLAFPGNDERCDGIDNDCDGGQDEDPVDGAVAYPDLDADGFGDESQGTPVCFIPDSWVVEGGDCDDSLPDGAAVNPVATELCNGIDDNCDSLVDLLAEDAQPLFPDDDGDGWGEGEMFLGCLGLPGAAEQGGDCAPDDEDVHPGADELCNGVDDDCDGDVDDEDDEVSGQGSWLPDEDEDGFGDAAASPAVACDAPSGSVDQGGDCDDSSAAVSPEADEVPGNGVDDDCVGGDAGGDEDREPDPEGVSTWGQDRAATAAAGCGCGAVSGPIPGAWAMGLALVLFRRRR